MDCHFFALQLDLENPVPYNDEKQALVVALCLSKIISVLNRHTFLFLLTQSRVFSTA